MKTRFVALLCIGVLGSCWVNPLWARPADDAITPPVVPAAESTPAASVVSDADDVTKAQDGAADKALVEKAKKTELCKILKDQERKDFLENKCKSEKLSDKDKKTCDLAKQCVNMGAVDTKSKTKSTEKFAQKDADLGGPKQAAADAAVKAAETQKRVERFGAYAEAETETAGNPLVQQAVARTTDGAVVGTALATGADRDLTVKDAGYATDAVNAGTVPTEATKLEDRSKFWDSYCREQGYNDEVCKAFYETGYIESKFKIDAKAKTTSASGICQYVQETWLGKPSKGTTGECQKYLKASSYGACEALRWNPKAQADVCLKSIDDRYKKYTNGNLDCRGLEFRECHYIVYHHSGSWIVDEYIRRGKEAYYDNIKTIDSMFANVIGKDPLSNVDLARMSLGNLGNYLPSNYFNGGSQNTGSNLYLSSFTQNPSQSYIDMLMAQSGYGQQMGMPMTMAANNPYSGMYNGTPVTSSPLPQFPTIVVSGDTTTLIPDAPQGCGGQVIDLESDVGLVKDACVEPSKPALPDLTDAPAIS